MKKILLPCDFSKPAINAFRFALDIAKQSKGSIHLLNVIDLPVLHDTVIMPVLNFEQKLLKELKEKAVSELNKIIKKYNTEEVSIVTKVQFGTLSTMVTDYIADQAIDLVLMGSHGVSGLREFFIGSNTEKIVRKSTVPVLVMKSYYKGPIKNIVFPNTLDTEEQEDLIIKVKVLQNFFKAKLHIVWINTPLNFTSDTITIQRLNAFAKRFMFKDFTINIFNHPIEEDGIIQFTNSIKGDLIAMGTHGRKGISHIISGSLTEDVVNHVDTMIWTYSLKKSENKK